MKILFALLCTAALCGVVFAQCKDGCAKCDSAEKCTACEKEGDLIVGGECKSECPTEETWYILNGIECVENCPDGTYPDTENHVCKSCGENCADCESASVCKSCKVLEDETITLYINGGECVFNCPTGKYHTDENEHLVCNEPVCEFDEDEDKYIPKDGTNCQTCNNLLCSECKEGYYLNEDETCTKCGTGCSSCISADKCTGCENLEHFIIEGECKDSCDVNHPYINGNECVGTCPTGKYHTDENEHLVCNEPVCEFDEDEDKYLPKDDSNCQTCNNLLCSECKKGYYLNEDETCTKCGTGCSSCDSTKCTECTDSEWFLNGNECVEKCPDGKYNSIVDSVNVCLPCKNNCAKCISSMTCNECVNDALFINGGECVEKCPAYVFEKTCYSNGCPDATYEGDGKTCHSCGTGCASCESDTKCTLCTNPNELIIDGAGACDTSCPTDWHILNDVACVKECPAGTRPAVDEEKGVSICESFIAPCECKDTPIPEDLTECVDWQPLDDSNCATCDKELCSVCSESFFLNDGVCVQECPEDTQPFHYNSVCVKDCPEKTYHEDNAFECLDCGLHCDVCDNTGKCTTCEDHFFLTADDECSECDAKCGTCSGEASSCTSCAADHYNAAETVGSFDCQPCGTGCASCDSEESCKKCKTETDAIYGGVCVKECPTGTLNVNNVCVKCDAKCAECENTTSSCKKCGTHFYNAAKEDGPLDCQECLVECGTCKDSESCTSCAAGYFDVNPDGKDHMFSCKSSCPPSTYASTTERKCKPCIAHCSTCTSDDDCSVCEAHHFLSEEGSCVECAEYCGSCSGTPETCTSCADGFYNTNTEGGFTCAPCNKICGTCSGSADACVTCADGYYNSNTEGGVTCTLCDLKCATCSDTNTCTSCATGFYNAADESSAEADCQVCGEGCAACSSDTVCTKCKKQETPLYIYGGVCLEKCPDHYYSDVTGCKICDAKCVTCEGSASGCLECSDGYFMSDKGCTQCSPALMCTTCSDAYTCDTCKDGYTKNEDGYCVYATSCAQFGEDCTKCNEHKCLVCEGGECCVAKGFLWNATLSKCFSPDELIPGCTEIEMFGEGDYRCKKCTSITCCGEKQYFDGSDMSCKDCGTGCKKCSAAGCKECEEEGYAINSNGECVTCADIFGDHCTECDSTKCTKADTGYTIVGSVIMSCKTLFGDRCETCEPAACKSCSADDDYKLISGQCKLCTEIFGEGCVDCDITQAGCNACGEDYNAVGPEGYKVCIPKNLCPDKGCAECAENTQKCVAAKPGHFVLFDRALSCKILPLENMRDACCEGLEGDALADCTERKMNPREVVDTQEYLAFPYNGESAWMLCDDFSEHCSQCEVTYADEGEFVTYVKCVGCAPGYVLYGEDCRPCSEFYDKHCSECTLGGNGCTALDCGATKEYDVSGSCQPCSEFNPRCVECEGTTSCKTCAEGYIKSKKDNRCYTAVELGCKTTRTDDKGVTTCTECTDDSCCEALDTKKKFIATLDKDHCGTCTDIHKDSNCNKCTASLCTSCKNNMVLDEKTNTCKACKDLFAGCSACNSDMCLRCEKSDGWIYTVNGCAEKQKPTFISSEGTTSTTPETSSGNNEGGSGDNVPTHPTSSAPANIEEEEEEEEEESTNVGMIVGIVIGCIVLIVIVAVALYCFITSGSKYGRIDPSIFEEDREFSSMAVL